MCRFMAVKSSAPIGPLPFLEGFARMCRNSKSYDGDWQGDGWGAAYVSKTNGVPHWMSVKSLRPIWEDGELLHEIPDTRMLAVHARSASFPEHKGVLEFCQPYVGEPYAFVFNGFLKGVSLPFPAAGKIGAQKIWSILQALLKDHDARSAIGRLAALMQANTRSIQAMNLGVCDLNRIHVFSTFTRYPAYYRLHRHASPSLGIVCSEPLAGFDFAPLPAGVISVL